MTEKHKRLRVGLIGAGMVSAHHLSAWATIPEAEIVGIADPDLERAKQRAEAFGIARVFPDAATLIRDCAPDALDIAAPVQAHASLCRLAAEHGVAICCQKPLAPSAHEAQTLVDDVGDRVRFMVHENWRHRPQYRQVENWLRRGTIGLLQSVRMTVTSSGLLPDRNGDRPALIRQPFLSKMPRCLVFEVLIHHLDVLSWLIGELSVVSAVLTNVSGAVLGEDTAVIHLRGPNRLPIQIEASLAAPSAPVHIRDECHIIGNGGQITVEDSVAMLHAREREQVGFDFDTMYAASYRGALNEFIAGLQARRPFETEAAGHVRILRLVDDIYALAGASAILR